MVNYPHFDRTVDVGVVIPIRLSDALEWSEGKLRDTDLVWRMCVEAPEAIYILHLRGIKGCFRMVRGLQRWSGIEAVCWRTETFRVIAWGNDHGAACAHTEPTGAGRWIGRGESVKRFLARFSSRS